MRTSRTGLGLCSVLHNLVGESLQPEGASQAKCQRLSLNGKQVKEKKLQTTNSDQGSSRVVGNIERKWEMPSFKERNTNGDNSDPRQQRAP